MDWNPGDYAIVAGRISTDEATQKSLTDQDEIGFKTAARLGLTVPEDGYYHDEMSRDRWPRPGLERAFERMTDPHCRALIVWEASRIYADPVQQTYTFEILAESDVHLYDESGTRKNGESELDEAMAGIESIFNKLEVLRTRRRAYNMAKNRAEHGIFVSRPPYGIQATEVPRVWEIVPEEIANLFLIFGWAKDGITPGEIETRLQGLGIGSRVRVYKSGKKKGQEYGGDTWSKSNIRKMITNEFYKGEYVWNQYQTKRNRKTENKKFRKKRPASEWTREKHALGEIIPAQLWEDANRQIRLRHKTKQESRVYGQKLFDGFLWCGRCGWKLYPRRRAKKLANGQPSDLFDYACTGTHQKYSSCTKNHVIPETWLFDILAGEVPRYARQPLEVRMEVDGNQEAALLEIQKIGEALNNLSERKDKVFELSETSKAWTGARVDARIQELEHEESTLEARRAELQARPAVVPLSADARGLLVDLVPTLQDESIPLVDRRLLLSRHFDRIVLDRPGITFYARVA